MKIVVLDGYTENPGDLSWEKLAELGELTVYDRTSYAESPVIAERIGDAEIVVTNKTPISAKTIDLCPNIKAVAVLATGYNVVDLEAAARRGIPVTNVPAYSTDSVAQHTFALLLDLASKVSMHDASGKAGDWSRVETFCYWKAPIIEIYGKTLGIYGFGNIGRTVAKIAKSFGLRILVHTEHPEKYQEYADAQLQFTDVPSI